jgi:hypothetical protein
VDSNPRRREPEAVFKAAFPFRAEYQHIFFPSLPASLAYIHVVKL